MSYPEYVEVKGKKYKINTDFRFAIRCDTIARDLTIGNYERGLAIICTLFEEKALDDALNDVEIHSKLLEMASKYLKYGKESNKKQNEKPNMDYEQDMDYIEASFMSDYHIDLPNEKMHYWKFFNLLNGLSNSELGSCCILNRVRNLRDFDLKTIKDPKEKQKIKEAKEQVTLKKDSNKQYTQEEQNNINDFLSQIGIRKE